MNIYDHPVFNYQKCPKGCGMTARNVLENDSLNCECDFPSSVRGEEIEEEACDLLECPYCNGYGETFC